MISYCIAVYRPTYASLLLADLVAKTAVPYEILLWLNTDSDAIEKEIAALVARGAPVRVLGRTPQNIGMAAYRELFSKARYPLIAQLDDDVVCISRSIAERAQRLFGQFPAVRQLAADVWQDEFTTGARPPLAHYRPYDVAEGLYSGPIDGWFSIYHRSILPLLLDLPFSHYMGLGAMVQARLARRGQLGLLDCGIKVFHVIGPAYAQSFGMLDFEIEKFRRLGRSEIVAWYEGWRGRVDREEPPAGRVEGICAAVSGVDASQRKTVAPASTISGAPMLTLRDSEAIRLVKQRFAPDGGAEREHNATPDTLGFGAIHESLIANLRPKRALIIGSRYGFVPCVVGLAMRANGSGELDFVDANYSDSEHGFELAFGGVGHWTDAAREDFSTVGLQDVVHIHVMRSEQFFAACRDTYEYVYLDGNHSYEGCKYDFEQAVLRTGPGGMIVLHDVLVGDGGFGVGRLFAELDPARFDKLLIHQWPGLGLVQPRFTGVQAA